ELVTVAPITTRVRRIPTEVPLGPADGLPKACVVNLDTLTTIPRRTLTQAIGPLSVEKLAAVERALIFALGLGHGQLLTGCSTGRVNVNVEPCPSSLLTQSRPPCSSTKRRASVNPSPVPSRLRA